MTGFEPGRRRKRFIAAAGILFVFAAGILAGYLLIARSAAPSRPAAWQEGAGDDDTTAFFRIYYPVGGKLEMEQRTVAASAARQTLAEAVTREYLKGPAGMGGSAIPPGTKLLGAYFGTDGILYVEFSEEFRSGFQGDALSEYLLLRGLYESLMSNITGIEDVRILIEGREVESLGGHIYAHLPLGEALAAGDKTTAIEGLGNEQ